jgi:DNA repair protein RadC
MKLKKIPWYNRPWTKIKKKGVSNLDDAELLSVIFTKGNPKENAVELSNKLLSQYNLHKFSNCSISELKKILGDEIKAYQIKSLGELFKRHAKLKNNGFTRIIEKSEDIYNIFFEELRDKKKEHLFLLMLDSKNTIIGQKPISVGTVNESLIHPREIFKEAVKESAYSIILVHNHPFGDSKPSQDDEIITQKIKEAGELMNIKLIDHVIISEDGYYSFNEKGKI